MLGILNYKSLPYTGDYVARFSTVDLKILSANAVVIAIPFDYASSCTLFFNLHSHCFSMSPSTYHVKCPKNTAYVFIATASRWTH